MRRRIFFLNALLAASAAAIPTSFKNMSASPRYIKPPRIRSGMKVALIAPSSPPAPAKIEAAMSNLVSLGLDVRPGKHLYDQTGHLAGPDDARLSDLHAAFADPEIGAVWCVRGGYGASRLLPFIDYDLIRRRPKPLVGYSDVTALHVAIHQRTGLVCFHGQVAGGDFPDDTRKYVTDTLFSGEKRQIIGIFPEYDRPEGLWYAPATIRSGRAEGRLTGGNLALLAALAGTPFSPKFAGKIVFIEDVGEQPYRIDRMLTQLLQSTDLRKAAGIALGVMNECAPKPDSFSLSLIDTLRLCLAPLGIPVVYGLKFGHISRQAVLPYGVKTLLDADAMSLTLLENAVGD